MNIDRRFSFAAVAALLALLAVLLVAQRFGFRWAGGPGFEPPQTAAVLYTKGDGTVDRGRQSRSLAESTEVARGEIVRTGEDGYAMLDLGSGRLSLAERTDVELLAFGTDAVRVRVLRGRVLAHAAEAGTAWELAAGLRRMTFDGPGAVSVVFYDFRDRAEVAPAGAPVHVLTADHGPGAGAERFTWRETFLPVFFQTDRLDEGLLPFPIDFLNEPGSGDFYRWVQQRNAFLAEVAPVDETAVSP